MILKSCKESTSWFDRITVVVSDLYQCSAFIPLVQKQAKALVDSRVYGLSSLPAWWTGFTIHRHRWLAADLDPCFPGVSFRTEFSVWTFQLSWTGPGIGIRRKRLAPGWLGGPQFQHCYIVPSSLLLYHIMTYIHWVLGPTTYSTFLSTKQILLWEYHSSTLQVGTGNAINAFRKRNHCV
jgi:hypothetical protein